MQSSSEQLAQRLKALADPIRMRLAALCGRAECSVSELTRVSALSQPRVSQHLKTLVDADLLERFRDGHFVYYRVPTTGRGAAARRQLLALLPDDEPQFERDLARLRDIRGGESLPADGSGSDDRSLHRALVELSISRPLGDLLDIGCGQGRILKLLAGRAHRAVGVDTDPDQRRLARAELLLAGTPNSTLRKGDMMDLAFADAEFDTVILDDVLLDASEPELALREAVRVLKNDGRLLVLTSLAQRPFDAARQDVTRLAADANLRLAAPRPVPRREPDWLLAVATHSERANIAA